MYYYVQEPYYYVPRSGPIQNHLWSGQEITQKDQFSEYYPQYPVRTYSLNPSYYPWHYHHHDGEWGYGGWSEKWHNGYNGTTLPNNNILDTERHLATISIPTPHIPTPHIPTPHIPTIPIPCHGYTGYQTNKFDLKRNVESGGWVAGWAEDIAEKDVAQGVVAAGVSVASSNPGPFLSWVENLVDRTISTLSSDVKQKFTAGIKSEINHLVADVIKQAIQGKSARETLKHYDTFDFKGGAIRYSGRNMLCGKTVSNTWGMKPYLAFRIR